VVLVELGLTKRTCGSLALPLKAFLRADANRHAFQQSPHAGEAPVQEGFSFCDIVSFTHSSASSVNLAATFLPSILNCRRCSLPFHGSFGDASAASLIASPRCTASGRTRLEARNRFRPD